MNRYTCNSINIYTYCLRIDTLIDLRKGTLMTLKIHTKCKGTKHFFDRIENMIGKFLYTAHNYAVHF